MLSLKKSIVLRVETLSPTDSLAFRAEIFNPFSLKGSIGKALRLRRDLIIVSVELICVQKIISSVLT